MRFIWTWWWAVVPIAVNIYATSSAGGFTSPVTVVMGGTMAIVFGLSACVLFHRIVCTHGAAMRTVLCIVGCTSLSVNLYNALDSASKLRSERSAHPRVLIDKRTQLQRRDADAAQEIQRLHNQSQSDVPEVLEALIRKLQTDPLWKRSNGCTNVTEKDSGSICDNLRSVEVRLAAARRADLLTTERRQIWSQLTELEGAPEAADPALSILVLATGQNEGALRAGIDGWIAVALELICAFMPALLARQPAPLRNIAAPSQPAHRPTTPFTQWVAERLTQRSGEAVMGKALQDDFAQWCVARRIEMPKGWQKELSSTLLTIGYEKNKGRRGVEYLGVALRPGRLTVVS